MAEDNPFDERLESLARRAVRRRLDAVLLFGEANIRSVTDVICDNGCLVVSPHEATTFITDFRYVPMAHRVAPWLKTVQLKRGQSFADAAKAVLPRGVRRLGYEGSVPTNRYLSIRKAFRRAELVDVAEDVLALRAVKTLPEIAKITRAVALNDEIWSLARKEIRPGMTEKDIQRVIRGFMNALGDGEAFETIVCAGANAAECHHVPDDTVWRRGEPLLVDMGVKLDGVCSDMTRCIGLKIEDLRLKNEGCTRASSKNRRGKKILNPQSSIFNQEYSKIYSIVLEANRAAIAAARPGMTCGALDKVARDIIRKAGYGKAFGHSLGHGVGYEIHEEPTARAKSKTVLEPGMFVTIEPGIYLEGKLGVRIEDLVLITPDGCKVITRSPK
jgi:Xaa-Pro aminopeptidase